MCFVVPCSAALGYVALRCAVQCSAVLRRAALRWAVLRCAVPSRGRQRLPSGRALPIGAAPRKVACAVAHACAGRSLLPSSRLA
eukprot:1785158-Alexandrium_andersonii.AAC.1